MVEGAAEAVNLLAPRLKPEQAIALRAGLTAGVVAIATLEGRRMPEKMPDALIPIRVQVEGSLRRMKILAAQECPRQSS